MDTPSCQAVHSSASRDAGSQYTSIAFTDHLGGRASRPSIGSVADAPGQRPDGVRERAVQDRVHPHDTIFGDGPYKNLADVEYATAGMGRLVQRRPTAQHASAMVTTSGIRASPLRCPQTRAAAHMTAAENPCRFTVTSSPNSCKPITPEPSPSTSSHPNKTASPCRLAFLDAQINAGDIEYEQAKSHLDDCLALAGDMHAIYMSIDDSLRRIANQAFFDKLICHR
jgi:hypothetical protein